jgi:AraC-like DNA-binding protein
LREVTPLSLENCFIYISRSKKEFTFPIHSHPEFELNFIEHAKGVKRIIGDSIEEIEDIELVLITGANLEHAWINGNCKSKHIDEITIQFHNDLFKNFLMRNQFVTVREMFEKARHGLAFPIETARRVKPMLIALGYEKDGFQSFVLFMQLIYELSLEKQACILSSTGFSDVYEDEMDSRRVKKVLSFLQKNYMNTIRLSDIAGMAGLSDVAFSRFFKKRTCKTFVEYLNEYRLGIAARLLVNTTQSVKEICYECGFNNLSNFNRFFKKQKGCTPTQFRGNYSITKIFI